jgi:anthranilate synthase/aminodeoxychorismate synthase-like glutamine amidotransferase
MTVLLIDNYDSFVHNLARDLRELGAECAVARNDAIDVDAILRLAPSHVVDSPGPGTTDGAGVSLEAIRRLAGRIPLLGVCLGHQCIAQAFGGRIVRASRPMHGKTSTIRHDGRGLFAGLPSPLTVTRYHSLVVDPASLPDELAITAVAEDGTVMALRHAALPLAGVQFHPEALLTERGRDLLGNFLEGGAAPAQ